MRKLLLVLVFLEVFGCAVATQETEKSYADSEVISFRENREKSFRKREVSPLRQEDFSTFEKLNYYPIENRLRLKGVFELTPDEKIFMLPTSTVRAQKYRKAGFVKFTLDGKNYTLGAFQRVFEQTDSKAIQINKDLFIPFKDLTNGSETYSAGRYVYIRAPRNSNEIVLDFNLAHNPACAYGDESFSCALPPKENFLQAEIKAGEKLYKNYGAKHE